MGMISRNNPNARYLSKVNTDSEGCWEWLGYTYKGYGRFNENSNTTSNIYAHRYMYKTFVHKGWHEKAHILHKCDNPGCQRPSHLFLGDAKANALDRKAKDRGFKPKGTLHPQAKLTEEIVAYARILYTQGYTSTELAEMYQVHRRTMHYALTGHTWKHVL